MEDLSKSFLEKNYGFCDGVFLTIVNNGTPPEYMDRLDESGVVDAHLDVNCMSVADVEQAIRDAIEHRLGVLEPSETA